MDLDFLCQNFQIFTGQNLFVDKNTKIFAQFRGFTTQNRGFFLSMAKY